MTNMRLQNGVCCAFSAPPLRSRVYAGEKIAAP